MLSIEVGFHMTGIEPDPDLFFFFLLFVENPNMLLEPNPSPK